MKTRNKALLLVLCAVMLVAGSVFGTMAYFTSTDTVENTFTVGSVKLKLDEADVTPNGAMETETRVKKNTYHLVPGHTYIKDPTVTVLKNSEEAYVRMIVTVKNIEQLKKALPQKDKDGNVIEANRKYYGTDDVFLLQELCVNADSEYTWDATKWAYFPSEERTNKGEYEFRYNGTVAKNENDDTKLSALFSSITVPSELNNDGLAYWGGWTGDLEEDGSYKIDENLKVEIVVTAHAIQADGFTDADSAWTAFDGQVNP